MSTTLASHFFDNLVLAVAHGIWWRSELHISHLRPLYNARATVIGTPVASLSEFRSWKNASGTGQSVDSRAYRITVGVSLSLIANRNSYQMPSACPEV